ncbi:MAG: redoxin domain-containing protein [Acidobacteriota bacterium]|nr:redoxin domain-containing protein [Acidobacteriota bacterium]
MANKIYEILVKTIDGTETNLSDYKDKVLLIVNVASKCGLTPQYESLEKLYENYRGKGFEVLGFPSNDFMGQEPLSETEIKDFCDTKFNVQFPLFSKISVNGEKRHPLYESLIEAKPKTDIVNGDDLLNGLIKFGHKHLDETDVLWNFEKFLIGKNGEVAARFAPDVTADDARLIEKLEAELAK